MAYINDTGEIKLTNDDKEELRGTQRIDVNRIIDWIIWGDPKGFIRIKTQKND